MDKRIKIYTNESIVHGQIDALEKILSRRIECEVVINVRDTPSSIQFNADENEIAMIRKGSDYNLLVRQGGYWLPMI